MKPEDENNKNKKPFTFDWSFLNEWLHEHLENIVEEPNGVWFVGGYKPDKNTEKKLIYWKNFYGEEIWKISYFIKYEIDIEYRNHLIANAVHTVSQPTYYRGLFEILN